MILTTWLSRIIAVALFTSVIAGSWDAWWHSALGRDTFWSPPHILLYLSIIVAVLTGMYGWHKTRERIWGKLAIILSLIPLSAPFDELWHRIFGKESLSSPLIVWSPPHLAIIAAIIVSFILLLPIIKREKDAVAKHVIGALAFAGILSLSFFLLGPIEPTGPWKLLGFWGAGVAALVFTGVLLSSRQWLPGVGGATLVVVFLIFLDAVGFSAKVAPDVIVPPHDHAPNWLIVFSLLIPALFIDVTKRLPFIIRGGVAGLLMGGIVYAFSSMFFEPIFQYTVFDGAVAIFASLIGGILAGIVHETQSIDKDAKWMNADNANV